MSEQLTKVIEEEHSNVEEINQLMQDNKSVNVVVTRWQLRAWKDELLALESKCIVQAAKLRILEKIVKREE